jgi:predicted site-specific integrase-resolvase
MAMPWLDEDDTNYVTLAEAGRRLHVARGTIYKWAMYRWIKVAHFRGGRRVALEEIRRIQRARRAYRDFRHHSRMDEHP